MIGMAPQSSEKTEWKWNSYMFFPALWWMKQAVKKLGAENLNV